MQMTGPMAGDVTCPGEFEMGVEFSGGPSDECALACRLKHAFFFSDTRIWSSLVLVLFLHSVLACLLWYSPKPRFQNLKWIEVQLVSMEGGANGGGPGSGEKAAAREEAAGTGMSAAQETRRETAVRESRSLPAENKVDVRHRDHVKRHAEWAPAEQKEKEASDVLQPVAAESARDGAPGGSGRIAGAGDEAPGGEKGAGGEGNGPVERAFGSPDGPSFLHRVLPSYPALAKRLEKQGSVLLRVTIDERGRPAQVEVLQRAGFGLDEEAVRAVRESTFVPAKKGDKPLTCKALLTIRFVLKES